MANVVIDSLVTSSYAPRDSFIPQLKGYVEDIRRNLSKVNLNGNYDTLLVFSGKVAWDGEGGWEYYLGYKLGGRDAELKSVLTKIFESFYNIYRLTEQDDFTRYFVLHFNNGYISIVNRYYKWEEEELFRYDISSGRLVPNSKVFNGSISAKSLETLRTSIGMLLKYLGNIKVPLGTILFTTTRPIRGKSYSVNDVYVGQNYIHSCVLGAEADKWLFGEDRLHIGVFV